MSRIDETALASVPAAVLEAELVRRAAEMRRANRSRPSQANGETVRNRGPPIDIVSNEDIEARTVEAFCKAFQISRSALYAAWAKGKGPRFFYVGTARRISRKAGEDWVELLEAATVQTVTEEDDEAA